MTNQNVPEWEAEFREYFDKCLKPKKPTMKNLDREVCVNFIRTQIQKAEARGAERAVEYVRNSGLLKDKCVDSAALEIMLEAAKKDVTTDV